MRISDWSSDVCSSDLRRPPVSGDWTAPTQPYSVGMPSFAGERLRERDMWGITPFDQLWCRIRFRQLRYQGPATAPATDESLLYPSIGGGRNWGGVSDDPERGLMIDNAIYYGTIARSETRRVGKEIVRTCRSRRSPYNSKKTKV